MYYSNKCQLLCTHERSAGGKGWDGMRVVTKTCKQWWARDEIEIYVRIMDSVHALLIWTEGNSKLAIAQKWIITDEATIAPDIKPCVVHTYVIPLYSKPSNFHVYYNAIALCRLLVTYISIPLKPYFKGFYWDYHNGSHEVLTYFKGLTATSSHIIK